MSEEPTVTPVPTKPLSYAWLWIVRALTIAAAALAAYLLVESVREGGLPVGCGADAGCGVVLNSRWSQWFGIPVSALAVLAYATMFLLTLHIGPFSTERRRRVAWPALVAMSIGVLLAALWFVIIQIFILGHYCVYCMVDHGLGQLAALLVLIMGMRRPGVRLWPMGLGVIAAAVLIGSQLAYQPPTIQKTVPPIMLLDSTVGFDPRTFPVIGDPARGRVVVSLFDYTCPHCRKMHEYLREVQRRDPRIAIVAMPVPLDADCNPDVEETEPRQQNACELAQLALTVWRQRPEKFAEFDTWLFEPETPWSLQEATAKARELLGNDAPPPDEDVKRVISRSIELHRITYGENNKYRRLPKLIGQSFIFASVPSGADELQKALDAEFARVETRTATTAPDGQR
jgi:uncharacterized membrane protein